MLTTLIATLISISIFIAICGLSFLITSGIILLICFCFGLAFSWKIALGIWLLIFIINVFLVRIRDIFKK